jgi:hypothetical protein
MVSGWTSNSSPTRLREVCSASSGSPPEQGWC